MLACSGVCPCGSPYVTVTCDLQLQAMENEWLRLCHRQSLKSTRGQRDWSVFRILVDGGRGFI